MAIFLVSAVWVYMDAAAFQTSGCKLSPILWALGAVALWIIFFPLYLVNRSGWKAEIAAKTKKRKQRACPRCGNIQESAKFCNDCGAEFPAYAKKLNRLAK